MRVLQVVGENPEAFGGLGLVIAVVLAAIVAGVTRNPS
jgi:hypothetical protein